MALDFSSAKAWRRFKLASKVSVGGMLIVAAFVIPMNAVEGLPLVPPSFMTAGPLLLALFLLPWFLWWAFLRLSEATLGRKRKDQ